MNLVKFMEGLGDCIFQSVCFFIVCVSHDQVIEVF